MENNTNLSNNPFVGLFKNISVVPPAPVVVQQVNEPTKANDDLQTDNKKPDYELNELLELVFQITLTKSNYESPDSKNMLLFIGDLFKSEDLINKSNLGEVNFPNKVYKSLRLSYEPFFIYIRSYCKG